MLKIPFVSLIAITSNDNFLFTVPLVTLCHGSHFDDVNLQEDKAHTPFFQGIASTEPLSGSVLIWKRVS